MEIQFFGANAVRLVNKKVSLVVDGDLESVGLKNIVNPNDVAVYTSKHENPKEAYFSIDGPGEYELAEISVKGIAARAHIDADGERATIYNVQIGGFSVGVIGHIYPDLSDQQLEELGLVDVLIVPVGGNGFTLDASGATALIKKIDPKIVIPTHYADSGIKYEVPQAELDTFLHEIGATDVEKQDTLKLKESELTDKTQVIVLNRK